MYTNIHIYAGMQSMQKAFESGLTKIGQVVDLLKTSLKLINLNLLENSNNILKLVHELKG